MVDVIGRAKVIIEGDVDSRSIDQAGGKIGSSLRRGAVVGVAALGTVAAASYKAVKSFEEAEAQSGKLSTVLGNMGESKAAPAVENLASELQRLTGVDDEVIKGGQTILATFSEVARSAGDVGGTFERASRASVDLAAAGFGSVESASVMLGKALQDPERGITALSRAGVTFTAQQKELIKSLVETGDTGKAQTLILAEVEKQVQGTGEASATESAKIGTAFGEVEEAAGHLIAKLGGEGAGKGGGLSGALFDLSDTLNETADSEGWGTLGEDIRGTGSDIGGLTGKLKDADVQIGKLILSIPGFGESLLTLISPTHGVISLLGDLVDALKDAYTWFKRLDGVSGDDVPDAPDVSQPLSTRASGGPSGGWTLVGESGPEILDLPQGSYVHSNSESQQMLASGGGGVTINQVFNGPTTGSGRLQEIDWTLRYAPRQGVA